MQLWKLTFQEAIGVMALALVLAASAYALRPRLFPVVPATEDAVTNDTVEGNITFIDLEAAIRHFNDGTAMFADARPVQAFNAGHIRGAMHLAPQAFDDWSSDVFFKIPVDQIIITYCDGAQCALSSELAEKLIWLGYQNVTVLKNGWHQWQSRNLPTEAQNGPAN